MADRSDHRRAQLRERAKQLAEQAAREPFEDRRRHLLDLVATYQRVAEQLEKGGRDVRASFTVRENTDDSA